MGLAISCPVGHFQVDQFLFLSRSHCTCNALKQDYTPTGLTIPQSVDKIFNDWQPLRGKNEKFYRHIKCSDRKAGFPDRVPSSPPVSHARRARPQEHMSAPLAQKLCGQLKASPGARGTRNAAALPFLS